ncbi:hypothetical protein GE21DRAFT_1049979 [Neurospora crassa]|nr:hypothetical protein GE21DRAFT_1049979 [Neurospora crassa]
MSKPPRPCNSNSNSIGLTETIFSLLSSKCKFTNRNASRIGRFCSLLTCIVKWKKKKGGLKQGQICFLGSMPVLVVLCVFGQVGWDVVCARHYF